MIAVLKLNQTPIAYDADWPILKIPILEGF